MDPPTQDPPNLCISILVEQKRKRRTKAEKEAKERKRNGGIARVAQLEDKMAVDDASDGSAHPRSNIGDKSPCSCHVKLMIQKKIFAIQP